MDQIVTIQQKLSDVRVELPDMTRADWVAAGAVLNQAYEWTQWRLGDWCLVGLKCFDRAYVNQQVKSVAGSNNWSIYVWVAQAFPPKDRVFDLSWAYYREAMRAPEDRRKQYLQKAVDNGWSALELRREIKDGERTEAAITDKAEFNAVNWSLDLIKWFGDETETTPLHAWPKESISSLISVLDPVVKIHYELKRALDW